MCASRFLEFTEHAAPWERVGRKGRGAGVAARTLGVLLRPFRTGSRRGRAVGERMEIRCSGTGGMGGRIYRGTAGALLNETRQTVVRGGAGDGWVGEAGRDTRKGLLVGVAHERERVL